MKHLKIVAVGDESIGKACFLSNYSANTFQSDYIPN
jgi:GTPase SAR1 family protein